MLPPLRNPSWSPHSKSGDVCVETEKTNEETKHKAPLMCGVMYDNVFQVLSIHHTNLGNLKKYRLPGFSWVGTRALELTGRGTAEKLPKRP